MKQFEPGCQAVSGPRLDIACEQHHTHVPSIMMPRSMSPFVFGFQYLPSCSCGYIGSLVSTVGQLSVPRMVCGWNFMPLSSLISNWTLVFAEDASGFNVTCGGWLRIRADWNLLSLSPF